MSGSFKVEPVQNTPGSTRTMSSENSNVESKVSLNDNRRLDADPVAENPKSPPVHPEFAFTDGNIEIQTSEHAFWVHEYHLNMFSAFTTLIQAAKGSETVSEPDRRIAITCEQKVKGIDIYNTLKVIYASHIAGIPDFDSDVIISTLRIASTHDYPSLRRFAISKLEGMKLPAIQRIQLSDEFLIPSWEIPAFTELCCHEEPISKAEAELLGVTRFAEIARIRETERTCWAVKLVSEDLQQLLGNSLQPGDSVNAEANSEYSSGRSKLPKCNCRATNNGPYYEDTFTLTHCDLHKVAPQLLNEGQLLLKRCNELLRNLTNVRSTINQGLQHMGSPSDPKLLDNIRKELSKASWVRKTLSSSSETGTSSLHLNNPQRAA